MYFINSTIYVEDADGNTVGEVRQRFHVWQRNYDIYLDRRQIAAINSPLLAWEFAIRDEQGGLSYLILPRCISCQIYQSIGLIRNLNASAVYHE